RPTRNTPLHRNPPHHQNLRLIGNNRQRQHTLAPQILRPLVRPLCRPLPILDQAASHLAGKLSIGKIDCTIEKKICKGKFDVRGYPTLKYYRDGEFSDYPLGRDLDSIVSFGEKMSQSAVKVVKDVGRFMRCWWGVRMGLWRM
ncbi:hypothetical protein QTG54_009186, partial [Skeletonema marinoi]